MDKRETLLLKDLELAEGRMTSNRDIFYCIANHPKEKFNNQDECDDLIAKLISEGKIDKNKIYGDDYFKPNKKLEKLLEA